MTPEQVMTQLLGPRHHHPDVPHLDLTISDGPYHTDVRASVVYVSNEQGERFRVEVRRG